MDKFQWIVVANIVGLNFWIIKEFLKTRGKEPEMKNEKQHCEEHGDCIDRIRACENCNARIKKDQASLDATFRTHARHVNKRLDEGRDDFKSLRKDISKMTKAITSIATVVEERTKSGGSLLRG